METVEKTLPMNPREGGTALRPGEGGVAMIAEDGRSVQHASNRLEILNNDEGGKAAKVSKGGVLGTDVKPILPSKTVMNSEMQVYS